MLILVTILAHLALLNTFPQCTARPLSEVDPDELVITTVNNASVCRVSGKQYSDGEKIVTGDPCEICRCRPPGFACNLVRCSPPSTPADPKGCELHKPPNTCCPVYVCLPLSSEENKSSEEKASASNTPKPPPIEINEIIGTPASVLQSRSKDAATVAPHSSEEGGAYFEDATVPPPEARKEDEETPFVILEEGTQAPSVKEAANVSARSDDEESSFNVTDGEVKARADDVTILYDDQDLNATKEFRSNEAASNQTEERDARASDILAVTPAAGERVVPTQAIAEESTGFFEAVTVPIFIIGKEPKERADKENEPANTTSAEDQEGITTASSRKKRDVEETEQNPITIKEFVVIVPEKEPLDVSAEEKTKELVPASGETKEVLQASQEEKDKVVDSSEEIKEELHASNEDKQKEVASSSEEKKVVLQVPEQEKDKVVDSSEEIKEELHASNEDKPKEVVPSSEDKKVVLQVSEQEKDEEVPFEETKEVLHVAEQEKDKLVPVEETKEVHVSGHDENKEVLQVPVENKDEDQVVQKDTVQEEDKTVFISEQQKDANPVQTDVIIPEEKKEVLIEQPEATVEGSQQEKKDEFHISEGAIKTDEVNDKITENVGLTEEKKDTLDYVTEANPAETIPEVQPEEDKKYLPVPDITLDNENQEKVESAPEHGNLNVQDKETETKQEVVPGVDEVNVGLPEAEIKDEKKSSGVDQEGQVTVVKSERKKRHEEGPEGHQEGNTVKPDPKDNPNDSDDTSTSAPLEPDEKVVVKNVVVVHEDKAQRRRKRQDAEEVPVPPKQVESTIPTIKSADTTKAPDAESTVRESEAQTAPSPTSE